MLPFAEHRTCDLPCCVKINLKCCLEFLHTAVSIYIHFLQFKWHICTDVKLLSLEIHTLKMSLLVSILYIWNVKHIKVDMFFFFFFSNPLILNIVLNQHLINGSVAWVLGFWIHGFQNILENLHLQVIQVWCERCRTYCWWTKSCTTKDDDYPIIWRGLTIPGGAGFLPSTVAFECIWHNHDMFLIRRTHGPGPMALFVYGQCGTATLTVHIIPQLVRFPTNQGMLKSDANAYDFALYTHSSLSICFIQSQLNMAGVPHYSSRFMIASDWNT